MDFSYAIQNIRDQIERTRNMVRMRKENLLKSLGFKSNPGVIPEIVTRTRERVKKLPILQRVSGSETTTTPIVSKAPEELNVISLNHGEKKGYKEVRSGDVITID